MEWNDDEFDGFIELSPPTMMTSEKRLLPETTQILTEWL